MTKWLHYFLIVLCLCNLLSVALYRFKLENKIKTQFEDIRANIARYEFGIFQDLTNQVVAVLGDTTNQLTSVYANFNPDLGRSLTNSPAYFSNIASNPAKNGPISLNYQFFTSAGAPWVELEGEYYTIDDEILGYGVISNCSRVAILLTNGEKIFNSTKKSFNSNTERVAKND